MRALLQGIADFRRTRRAGYSERFTRLASGQAPAVLAIACSDSRLAAVEFGVPDPGEVFVVRNVGNFVPPFEEHADKRSPGVGAAVEYALNVLPVEDIVVCGHSGCGAVHAIREGHVPPDSPHLEAWLAHGRRLFENLPPAPPGLSVDDHASQQGVLRHLDALRTYSVVAERERAGRLHLHAWWFDVAHAELLDYDAQAGRYVPLDEERIERRIAEARR